jgi:hypothetical protein
MPPGLTYTDAGIIGIAVLLTVLALWLAEDMQ